VFKSLFDLLNKLIDLVGVINRSIVPRVSISVVNVVFMFTMVAFIEMMIWIVVALTMYIMFR